MAMALREGRPIRNAEAVAERPDGTRVPFIPFPTPLRDASGNVVGAINMLVDISERRQAETQQRLLLNELNHRTKNNMQMLQSLVFTAARRPRATKRGGCSTRPARALPRWQRRSACSMAQPMRVILPRMNFSGRFVRPFSRCCLRTSRSSTRIASGVLSNDTAMPLALILNELLTNAVKHGTKDSSKESVRVGLTEKDGKFELYVEDGGDGFDLDAVRNGSSGLQLVLGLAGQLRGAFEVTRAPSRAVLRFAAGRPS